MFSFFQTHPEEIKIEIFKYLSDLERVKLLPRVCKEWNRINKKMTPVLNAQENFVVSRDMISAIGDLEPFSDSFSQWNNLLGNDTYEQNHQKCIDKIKKFLAKGGDPNTTNECYADQFKEYNQICTKSSLLHGAAIVGSVALAKMLINKGANVNYQTVNGHTPLHYAVFYRRNAVARLIVNNQADISIRDNDNRSAAELACVYGLTSLAEAILTNSNWELALATEHQISDKEMAQSAFGQASNTAKSLNFR